MIHQKSPGLNKTQYNELQKEDSEEFWYCRHCRSSMFPFMNLSNHQFCNLIDSTNLNIKKTIGNQPSSVGPMLTCVIFLKRNNKNNGLKYKTCNFLSA